MFKHGHAKVWRRKWLNRSSTHLLHIMLFAILIKCGDLVLLNGAFEFITENKRNQSRPFPSPNYWIYCNPLAHTCPL